MKTLLNFTVGIGNWRVSKTEEIKFPIGRWDMRENNEIVVEALNVNKIELTLIYNLFEEHRRVMIRAECAGSGKSFCCEHMLHKGHKLLFVCPTKVLSQKKRRTA